METLYGNIIWKQYIKITYKNNFNKRIIMTELNSRYGLPINEVLINTSYTPGFRCSNEARELIYKVTNQYARPFTIDDEDTPTFRCNPHVISVYNELGSRRFSGDGYSIRCAKIMRNEIYSQVSFFKSILDVYGKYVISWNIAKNMGKYGYHTGEYIVFENDYTKENAHVIIA